jgi:uncharacterized membrane protein
MNKLYTTIKLLSILGIFLASYLFYEYITRPPVQVCYVNSTVNCDAVTKGPVSTLYGVPVSLVGLIGYLVIVVCAFAVKPKLVFAMSLFGLLFCLRITFIEVFHLHVICPVCLTCQLDMLIVFVLACVLNFKKPSAKAA